MAKAPAPLFQDPIFNGPADPTIIWNHLEKQWWIIYTARRANVACHGLAWYHGTDLGVASSRDGQSWTYRGTLNVPDIHPGRNTFWAPEVVFDGEKYHMFVSYIDGIPTTWEVDHIILHYVSANLWDWQFDRVVDLPHRHAIDACVHRLADGTWRMWYKDEPDNSYTHYADSADLSHWTHIGAATNDQPQEGPNVFKLADSYWLIADIWDGQAVYRSDDLTHWVRQEGRIMSGKGKRADDGNRAHHADVLSFGDHAYLFYFVNPEQTDYTFAEDLDSIRKRRSSLQVAQLQVKDGKLVCSRDDDFDFYLPEMK